MDWTSEITYRRESLSRDAELVRAARAARRRKARETLGRVLRFERPARDDHRHGDLAVSAHHDDNFVTTA